MPPRLKPVGHAIAPPACLAVWRTSLRLELAVRASRSVPARPEPPEPVRSVLGGREGYRGGRPEAVFQGDVARVEVPARVDDVGGQGQVAVLPGAGIGLGRDDQAAGGGLVHRVQRADVDVEPVDVQPVLVRASCWVSDSPAIAGIPFGPVWDAVTWTVKNRSRPERACR